MGKRKKLLLIGLILGTGCFGGRPTRPTGKTDGRATYENVTLTIGCSDPVLVEALSPFAAGWATRTHGSVSFTTTTDTADLVILPPAAFGTEAARGGFQPLPDDFLQAGHPVQGSGFIIPEKIMAWGRQVYGIILGAGADVLLFRTDVNRGGRPLTPAATWEELLEQAQTVSRDGPVRAVLPPLPADDAALLHQFHLIAAGFDRQAIQSAGAISGAVTLQGATFHHDLSTGAPRIKGESFVAALSLMKQLQAFRPNGTGDPVDALKSGQALIAVVSLADLGRLASAYQGRIPDHFAIAPVPGTRQTLDPLTRRLAPAKTGVNGTAYLGDSGSVGAVRKSCANPAAAFDLLAELGSPATALKLVANPALGLGPWRREQVDAARREIWNGYGLNPDQMTKLATALKRSYANENPVLAPRGPDAAPQMAALAARVRSCLTGTLTPEAALAEAEAEWLRIDAGFPAGDPAKWRREAAGLSGTR